MNPDSAHESNQKSLVIRLATPADATGLATFAEQAFRATFDQHNTPQDMDEHCRTTFGTEIQFEEISNLELLTLLGTSNGNIVAFAQVRPYHNYHLVPAARPAELNRFYVDAGWHGQGVAQRMMDSVLAACAEANSEGLWLGVWEHNPRAITFYKKFGFQPIGQHTFMLGQDVQQDVIMFRASTEPGRIRQNPNKQRVAE